MKITAMVLLGDNEPYLKYCLESIIDLVDEILVLTHGSSGWGGIDKLRIIRLPLTPMADFSEWRNRCLKEAKGDWILYIDADEVLAKPNGKPVHRMELESLIKYADDNNVNGFHIFTLHFLYNYRTIDGTDNGKHYSICRFFRKKDVTKYEGKIHELPKFRSMPIFANLNTMFIWHFGHCKGMENLREKYRRTFSISDNPYTKNLKISFDKYCANHELFRVTRPMIQYDGSLPSVMKLW
jgi:glycosyltransferase involved in cell wall biosynthesis